MATINLLENALPTAERRRVLNRRIRYFVGATIAYNVIEAIIALGAGMGASSSALIGFGLDSVVEVSSAAALAWQFSARDPETREKKALRIIAFSFFALAAFVTADALGSLITGREADHSSVGIILAAVSLAIMPVLSWAQRRAGRELGSLSAVADSKQTLLCTYLSAVLLVGLLLNSVLGWSWADPIAALVIAGIAVKEGLNAWRGDTCCTPLQPSTGTATDRDRADCCEPTPASKVVGTEGFDCACCQPITEQS
ncbi:Cation efflux family protein [Arthrobacter alpinus]|uniref:Cation efflux family protein n=1 Tax=Arthrobacter alpinus TaxID=656366 RepID=A0A1H5I3J6_9MICC|nr:cation transporter [Arthrobacter alpinus]SEE34782.1 Cation efflux family protein [Arthrobacter alpinus]